MQSLYMDPLSQFYLLNNLDVVIKVKANATKWYFWLNQKLHLGLPVWCLMPRLTLADQWLVNYQCQGWKLLLEEQYSNQCAQYE